MTDHGGNAIRGSARALVTAVVLTLGASGLWAQGTTGKVQGTVFDPTGQPVANAQVFILGTAFAATTNEDGFYFINNVPAGNYELRGQFIGYQPAQIEGVRILADQTMTVDFRLSGAVALEAITITAAEAPIVPRDQVTSKAIITGEEIDQLPTYSVTNVVRLQPGVVIARGGDISIRGGRSNEAVWFIDGAPVRRFDTGSYDLGLSMNSLAEVSVTTGAMEASFGDAQAGVISVVSRSGGPNLRATLAYEGDNFMPKSLTTGYTRYEASLSGPVMGNLTFAVGGVLTGDLASDDAKGADRFPTYTFAGIDTVVTEGSGSDSIQTLIPKIIQYGGECDAAANLDAYGNPVSCQGRLGAYNWGTDLRLNGRLQMTYGGGSRFSLSGYHNLAQNLANGGSMNFEVGSGTRRASNVLVLNWVQQVFRGAESELAFDLNLSYQTDRSLTSPFYRGYDLSHRGSSTGIVLSAPDFITDWDRFSSDTTQACIAGATGQGECYPATAQGGWTLTQLKTQEDWDRAIENMRYDNGTLRSYLNRSEVNTRAIPRMNAFGITGTYSNLGVNTGQTYLYERRYTGRFNMDWQADRYNRFKFGTDGQVGWLGRWAMGWTTKSFGAGYTGEPYKIAAYAQDHLDLGDVVLEVGARWEKFDTRTIFPLVPGRIFTNPAFDDQLTVDAMTCPQGTLRADCNVDQYVWFHAQSHDAWAPRVRVSFPVTDRTGFRLSYAHQVQAPDLNSMYNGTNNDLANTNTNDQFGGDVDFAKTIIFEFGIRHAFSPDMLLDISAYNKDKVSDWTYRILPFFDTFSDRISNVNVITNADFGNVRGMDIQLIRRFGNVFQGQASYTLQNSQSTGSDPTDYLNGISRAPAGVTATRPEAPQYTLRTRDDRRHNIQGTFSLSLPQDFAAGSALGSVLGNLGVYGTFQVRSGLPYTRLRNYGRGNKSNGGFGLVSDLVEPLQSSETPWEKYFDLRVTKGFNLGPVAWTAYADIRNLFNFENRPTVFNETGDVVNEEYLRVSFLEPQLLAMEQDARASNAWKTITKGEGVEQRAIGAIDLTNVHRTCSGWVGAGGPVACVMLQRTEQRFGDGDGVYDVEEQTAAVTAFYNQSNAPETFFGEGRIIRLGLQVQF